MSDALGSDSLVCPRCGQPSDGRFYGPCGRCRQELVARYQSAGDGADPQAAPARFEPAMHVVANQVATKD